MNRRTNVLTNGQAFREARELKLLTLEAVPDAMVGAGLDCVSKNSVWKAEAGGPVSFKAVELLCKFYDRNPRVLKLACGQLHVEPAIVDNELQRVAKVVKRLVMEDIDGETTREELLARLNVLQQLIGDEVIRMTNFKLGSLHFDAEVSPDAAEFIDELFNRNSDGEHVVPNLLDDDVYLQLKDRLYFRHTVRCLLDEAMEKFAPHPSWTEFYKHFFGVEGRVRECFPTEDLRMKFQQSKEHDELLEIIAALRSVKGEACTLAAEPERMITVRLPKSVHEVLMKEAEKMRTSVNRLAVSKLIRAIPKRLVAVSGEGRSRCHVVQSYSKPISIPDCDIVWLVANEDGARFALNERRIPDSSNSCLQRISSDRRFAVQGNLSLFVVNGSNEWKDRYIELDYSGDVSNLVCTVVETQFSAK